jgi:hypothetical protein
MLKRAGHTLVLFSHNHRAAKRASALGIRDWFDFVTEGCHDMCKEWNWQEVRKKYPDVKVSETVRCMSLHIANAAGVRTPAAVSGSRTLPNL